MQQKRCPLSSALSGLCKGGAARQTLPHRSGAPRHEVFPAMVRVRWHRIGINAQMGARPQRCNEVAASKKTGHGIADHRRCWSVLLGMDAQPVALQPEGLRFRVFQRATRGLTHATPDRVFLDNVHWRTMPDVARDPGWPRCRTATSCTAAAGSVKSACWALAGRS